MRRGKISFLKLAIGIIGVLVLILCFLMPGLANNFIQHNPEYSIFRYPILAGIYTAAIPFYTALYQALKTLKVFNK
ncbi:MAG TPA: DUF2975 domain-containing protein [Desulfobacteria bacterium]|nr:DUF2975 domain-containing protein [Desulfobacteria bacterium]